MDKQLHSSIDIDATPERVWEVLTDFAAYPQWNPFMPEVTGTPRVGERLKVRLQPPGGRGMTFQPPISRCGRRAWTPSRRRSPPPGR